MMYLYSNIIGTFVFNQNFRIREKVLFSKKDLQKNYLLLTENKELPSEKIFLTKFKNNKNLRQEFDLDAYENITIEIEQYSDKFYSNNLYVTMLQIADAAKEDQIIIQTIGSINELNKAINLLSKRLREWTGYYLPELSHQLNDHKILAQLISSKSRDELVTEFKIEISMGKDLDKSDSSAIKSLASTILDLFKQKESKEQYLEKNMQKTCKNLNDVAGCLIGAKLLAIAGGLRNMVMMPSSTIQLLGAEKALFMHMTKGTKSPKHGVIIEHQLLATSKASERGKRARALADKIGLAVKVDFFKGKYIADRLNKELKERFS